MRTTLDIQDDLLRRARIRAAESGRTIGDLVSDALRVLFDEHQGTAVIPDLPCGRPSRLAPGADLSPRGLAERLEDEDLERARGPR